MADQEGEGRLFRVSRVVSAAVDEAPVRRRDGVELGALWEELRRQVEERPAEVRVVVRVRREWLDLFRRMNASHLVDGSGDGASGSSGGGDGERAQVRLRSAAVMAARTLLGYGANVEVVSPPEVRADLAQVAAEVVAQYGIEHAFGRLSG